MDEERRKSERIPLSLEARWEGLSGKHTSRVSDVSLGGCFLDTTVTATEGETIDFEIKLPTGEWLPLRGQVAFHQHGVGFSVRFINLTEAEHFALAKLINR